MYELGPLDFAAGTVLIVTFTFLAGMGVGYLLRSWQQARGRRHEEREARRAAAAAARDSAHTTTRHVARPAALPARRRTDAAAGDRSGASVGRPRVLVADDHLELVALHGTYLERHGYEVITAADGDEALKVARAKRPSVIVLDHSMPGRSGLDVVRALKADPATAEIPILLMTAHSYGAVGASAREAGCAAFMSKPCDPSRLLREIAVYARPTPEPRAAG